MLHLNYQVKPHLSQWFSGGCAISIHHRNYFSRFYPKQRSCGSNLKITEKTGKLGAKFDESVSNSQTKLSMMFPGVIETDVEAVLLDIHVIKVI